MQTIRVFAVYDMKMKGFMQPFFCQNSAVATRMFVDSVNGDQNIISKHPEDFALYEVGMWDEETGLLTPLDPKTNLGLASSFVELIKSKGNGDGR